MTATSKRQTREPLLHPGQIVGSHRVERMVGRGGLAEVYLVTERSFGVQQALKVLVDVDRELAQRLFREGRTQYLIQHPNILRVFSSLTVLERPALLMEYVDGPDLRRWLSQQLREDCWPSLDAALVLFQQILDGMEAAHGAGLVHRDLKPGNILLELRRDGPWPRISDFGLVKEIDTQRDGEETTSVGTMMGSRGYSAPEQLWGIPDIDQRADIFSLGCILYLLVCGKTAFDASEEVQVMRRILHEDYQDPREIVPGLPEGVILAIRHSLAPERRDRLPDCAALRAVIRDGAEALFAMGIAPRSEPRPRSDSSLPAPPRLPPVSSESSLHPPPRLPPPPIPSTAPTVTPARAPAGPVRWALMGAIAAVATIAAAAGIIIPTVMFWPEPHAPERAEAPADSPGQPRPPSPDIEPSAAPPPEPSAEPPVRSAPPTAEPPVRSAPPSAEPPARSAPPSAEPPARSAPPSAEPLVPTEPEPEPPPSPQVGFTVSGIDRPVCLHAGADRYCSGQAPPGQYQIMLTDSEGQAFSAGQVTLDLGKPARITCDPVFQTCF